ncbi:MULTISPECIES: adenylate/guanylate cyclase domain-containing protein [unclassified Labrenzia]|uniref:adenylate/guanylate cyclase domain-containing protein n=1 Tax=unclassified Labrenzia TaxID=2648686 RepID=UPI0013785DFC|nr:MULTISPECIES: adenylate/guanylate cyclase domain-containing protein [unclassified Labrenzia]
MTAINEVNNSYQMIGARSVLIIDLVESVRLIEENERETVGRWIEFVDQIELDVLPNCSGRLKKRLGDGLLIDFDRPRDACAAALAIKAACREGNRDKRPSQHFLLRMGIDAADVFEDDHDLYGQAVNRAARLMALATPGDILISAEARNQAIDELDAGFEDLGECYLKHIREPVRTYRVLPLGEVRTAAVPGTHVSLNPTLAIVPFVPRLPSPECLVIGEILSDELIQVFSASQTINVISHLSTSAFTGRIIDLGVVRKKFSAEFVLSGRFVCNGQQIELFAELSDTATGLVIWSDEVRDRLPSLYSADRAMISKIVASVSNAINLAELKRARSLPLPNLQTHSLLMAAITLMHRMSRRDFHLSFEMLEEVVHRAGRQSVPHSWMAKWHVLKMQQGWSENADQDAYNARVAAERALDADPDSSLALTIDGLVQTHILKDHDTATERYQSAVRANPNNSLAWLLKGTDHAFTGDGVTAVADTQKAIQLSPLDPHRYYYDTLAATAFLANRQFEQALEFADRSLRANRMHTSSLRAKAVACWQLGMRDEARRVGKMLMDMEPNLSIKAWRARSPSAGYPISDEWARVLKKVGVPD